MAGRAARPRTLPAAARRVQVAGTRLVGDDRDAEPGRRQRLPPACDLLPAGAARAPVLVRHPALPRHHLPRHGRADHRRGGTRVAAHRVDGTELDPAEWGTPNRHTRRQHDEGSTTVLFLGDSITAQGSWDTWLPGERTLNQGIDGDTTDGVLARLDARRGRAARGDRPADRHERLRQPPVERRARRPRRRVDPRHAPTRTPGRATPARVDPAAPGGVGREDRGGEPAPPQFVATCHAQYLDAWPALADGDHLDERFTDDGLHLTEEGYQAYVAELLPALERVGTSRRCPVRSRRSTSRRPVPDAARKGRPQRDRRCTGSSPRREPLTGPASGVGRAPRTGRRPPSPARTRPVPARRGRARLLRRDRRLVGVRLRPLGSDRPRAHRPGLRDPRRTWWGRGPRGGRRRLLEPGRRHPDPGQVWAALQLVAAAVFVAVGIAVKVPRSASR